MTISARPGGLRTELLLNVAGPFVAYQVLSRAGVGPVPALAVAAVFPVVGTVRGWVRARRPNALGLLSLLFILLGIAVSFAIDSPLVLLLKGSVINAAYGLLCLSSLLWRRPLLFYVSRQIATGGDRHAMDWFDQLWRIDDFRAAQRRTTVVWAAWGLAQALARTVLALQLPIGAFLAIWPPLDLVVTVALVAWTVRYTRRAAGAISEPPPTAVAPAAAL